MVTFRRSKKVGPFRFTISPRGISSSVGVRGARLSVNSRGQMRRTFGIPGTGIYDTKVVNPKGADSVTGGELFESPAPAQPPAPTASGSRLLGFSLVLNLILLLLWLVK